MTVDAPAGEALWLSKADTERATGWSLRAEGFCKGDLCVPLPPDRADEFARDDRVNVSGLWALMDRPAARSRAGDVWVLGEAASARTDALRSLEAPDFTLPDFDGKPHSLRDLRGKRVLLLTWASW